MRKRFFSFRRAYYNLTVNQQRELRAFLQTEKGWNNLPSFYKFLDNVAWVEDYDLVTTWFEEHGIPKDAVWEKIEA